MNDAHHSVRSRGRRDRGKSGRGGRGRDGGRGRRRHRGGRGRSGRRNGRCCSRRRHRRGGRGRTAVVVVTGGLVVVVTIGGKVVGGRGGAGGKSTATGLSSVESGDDDGRGCQRAAEGVMCKLGSLGPVGRRPWPMAGQLLRTGTVCVGRRGRGAGWTEPAYREGAGQRSRSRILHVDRARGDGVVGTGRTLIREVGGTRPQRGR